MISWAKEALMTLACILLIFFAGYSTGSKAEKTECNLYKAEVAKQQEETRDKHQQELNEVVRAFRQGQKESQESADRLVADAADRNVRLRVRLADDVVAAVQAGNRQLADGKAELHRETATALVRITQDADRQVEALQGALKAVTRE